MGKNIVQLKLKQLYLISFIEGGVVMVAEIAGARMLTPFFGASLYSWAATLSITLFALMAGYYYGGFVTTRPRFAGPDKVVWIFFFSGITVMLMPSLGHFAMKGTLSFPFFTGLIFSEVFFLFLPIFLMGMISPMIIFQVTQRVDQSGRSAGNIYAISTSGGIVFTLVFGFLIVPWIGITAPLRVLGLAVALLALLFLARLKMSPKRIPLILTVVVAVFALVVHQHRSKKISEGAEMQMLENSEGLLGELQVVDKRSNAPDGSPLVVRKLRTNNVQQNYVFASMPTQSLLYYVNFTRQFIKSLGEKRSALLVGLGAGSLYKVLSDEYKQVETVEIDKRIYDMGLRYFGMAPHNCHITDGRYFINTTQKKYDLLILDVIIGESVPAQLVSLESFKRCYDLLENNGTLIVEHGGVSGFSDNVFIPSIYKTISAAGFKIAMFNPLRSNDHGDVLFIATKQELDKAHMTIGNDVFIPGGPLTDFELLPTSFDQSKAIVMTDEVNRADLMLRAHYFKIRKSIRRELMNKEL